MHTSGFQQCGTAEHMAAEDCEGAHGQPEVAVARAQHDSGAAGAHALARQRSARIAGLCDRSLQACQGHHLHHRQARQAIQQFLKAGGSR